MTKTKMINKPWQKINVSKRWKQCTLSNMNQFFLKVYTAKTENEKLNKLYHIISESESQQKETT